MSRIWGWVWGACEDLGAGFESRHVPADMTFRNPGSESRIPILDCPQGSFARTAPEKFGNSDPGKRKACLREQEAEKVARGPRLSSSTLSKPTTCCKNICTCVCVCVCVRACARACVLACLCVRVHACTHHTNPTCPCTHTHIQTRTHKIKRGPQDDLPAQP